MLTVHPTRSISTVMTHAKTVTRSHRYDFLSRASRISTSRRSISSTSIYGLPGDRSLHSRQVGRVTLCLHTNA